MHEDRKLCLFALHKVCYPYERMEDGKEKFGTEDWILKICAFCIKATYARSHKKKHKYAIVNTL